MGQPCNRNENGVESFPFFGEKMERERNQRFFSLDRAIKQNQHLNHVCPVRVSPSFTARPHTVARHATHRKPSIRYLSRLLVDGSRHGVLALLEEIDELGEDS